ncbi:MAG TPA: hypothetical protein VFR35_16720 [Actinoplanes sp.]|nr:hypothetical protein [Actinoplanes sp.]
MRKTMLLLPALLLALAGCAAAEDARDGVATAGGATPAPSASSTSAGAGDAGENGLRFAQCMREQGMTWFEDPVPGERGIRVAVPKGQDKEKVDAAMEACRKFLPNGGEPPKLDAEALEQARQMAKCMRENGVPGFPDPGANGEIQLDAGKLGMGPGDPTFDAAEKACARFMPDLGRNEQRAGS